MMAGNPNTLSLCLQSSSSHHHLLPMNNNSQNQFVYGSTNIAASGFVDNHNPINESPLRSWSHLLLREDKDRYGELEQGSSLNHCSSYTRPVVHDLHVVDVKQEQLLQPSTCQLYDYAHNHDGIIFHQNIVTSSGYCWPAQQNQSAALSNGFLNFSGGNKGHQVEDENQNQHQHNQDQSSECDSTKAGRLCKKARVQQSSSKPALKVRKEKLGDRITALHQLVSPFGKTDTASVLSEAIGYIRFLQGQIEALSTPYMHNAISATHHQHSEYQSEGDLRRLGLCLVPISCTQNVGNYNTSNEYWAPAAFGRDF